MSTPLSNSKFNLDVSGVAAFFGGEESFSAMSSVHLIRWRQYLGWYNSPGSYFVAKKYGTIPITRVWKAFFPGPTSSAELMLELDGRHGSRYIGTQSGTNTPATGHLVHLLESHCEEKKNVEYINNTGSTTLTTQGHTVSVVELNQIVQPFCEDDPVAVHPMSTLDIAIVSSTILFNLAAAVIPVIMWRDWACFAAILVGIFCNGFACVILGAGDLTLSGPGIKVSPYSPPGDGIIGGDVPGKGLVLIKAPEDLVVDLTRGKFHLKHPGAPKYHMIGIASCALSIQAFAQLVIVPQATLAGQLLFLSTLAISWLYNAYLASTNKEKLKTEILLKVLNEPKLTKVSFSKYAAAVAAAVYYLRPAKVSVHLDQLLPNDTPAWTRWKKCVEKGVNKGVRPTAITWSGEKISLPRLSDGEQKWLDDALEHAGLGYDWYEKCFPGSSKPPSSITTTSTLSRSDTSVCYSPTPTIRERPFEVVPCCLP